MSTPKSLPSSTFATGNYGAGANPWNSQPKRVAPANYYFTPNTTVPAEEVNSIIGVMWDAIKGLIDSSAIRTATNFPHHFDLRSRAVRTLISVPLIPVSNFGTAAAEWDGIFSPTYLLENDANNHGLAITLNVRPGSILHGADVYIKGYMSGATMPTTRAKVSLAKINLSTGVATTIVGPTDDATASRAAYEATHAVSVSGANEIVSSEYRYIISFSSGSGGNKLGGTEVYGADILVSDPNEGSWTAGYQYSAVLDARHSTSDPDGVGGTWWVLVTSLGTTEFLLKSRDSGATWDFVWDSTTLAVDGASAVNLIEGWSTDEIWLFGTGGGSFRKYVPSTNTWSNVAGPVASTTWYDSEYFAGGNVIIGLGANGTTPKLVTYNGTSWTDRSASISGTWSAPCAVACSSTVALVWYGTTLYTSSNGTTWTSRTAPATLKCVCWSETHSKFIAAAGSNIYTSPDGITWTSAGAAPANLSGLAASGAVTLAIAAQADSDDYQHWYSLDAGTTWSRASDFRHPAGDLYTTLSLANRRSGAYAGRLAVSKTGDQLCSFSSVRASFGLKG